MRLDSNSYTLATLCILVEDTRVLLGIKKNGFGRGKITAFGGKIEPGETPPEGAARELSEETGLRVAPGALQPCGHITFVFPAKPAWNHFVYIFRLSAWTGDPQATAEIEPVWFDISALPAQQMWQDSIHWLPLVIAGHAIEARFVYANDNETLEEAQVSRLE